MLKTRVANGYCSPRPRRRSLRLRQHLRDLPELHHRPPSSTPAIQAQLADIHALRDDANDRGWTSETARHNESSPASNATSTDSTTHPPTGTRLTRPRGPDNSACQAVRTSPPGSPASSSPSSLPSLSVVEAFVGDGHQLADPVERVVLRPRWPSVSFCTRRRVSRARVGELHDVERIGDLGGVRAASCRTPPDTAPTDPTSPNGSQRTTRRAARRTMRTCWQRRDQAQRRAVVRGRRRRPASTTPDA